MDAREYQSNENDVAMESVRCGHSLAGTGSKLGTNRGTKEQVPQDAPAESSSALPIPLKFH